MEMRVPTFREKYVRACLLTLMVIASISVWQALISDEDADSRHYLSITLKSQQEGVAALYYDIGKGFNDRHVESAFIKADKQISEYLFKIPDATIYHLRWDPPASAHEVISIIKMEILDGSHSPVKRLSLRQLEPLHQIQAVALSDVTADFRIQEEADDPQIKIRLESPLSVKALDSRLPFPVRLFLEFLGLSLSACLLIYIWLCRKDKVVASVILISLVFFGWRSWALYDSASYLFLQVAMSSSVDSTAQVYYNAGQGLNENQSQRMHVTSQEDFRQYRFKLPNKTIYDLRFDPLMMAGKLRIGEVKVTDTFGNLLREIPLQQLEPMNQIKSISTNNGSVEIVVSEEANDPQISISLQEPLDYEDTLPFPARQWLLVLLKELVILVLWASVVILVWKKWGNALVEGLESSFIQEKMPLMYMGSALGLILAMATVSGLDVNPDEWNGHVKAAAYYIENWLPPAVDDPRIVNSISVFGVSYLWHIDPYYFFAVKVTQVLSGVISDFYLRARLANALLFLSLVLVFATQIKRSKWMVPFIVISPQVWYVFSYFNNDAFPLFIALILAMQVVDPESFLNRFLSAPTIRHNAGGGVLIGILIGLLLCSKLNYRLYIAFLIFVGSWKILFEATVPQRIMKLKKWVFLFSVALLVYLPLYGYDQYVNDFQKDEKVPIVMERHAVPQFKPSRLQNDLSSSYPGLRLKDKGVSFRELFLKSSDWRDLSFKSFFGLYGYMDLVSAEEYYQAVTYVVGVFFLLVFYHVAFTLPARDVIFLLVLLLFAGLIVGQSVYHSWINDYQPQGRYLFPILPMLMVGLSRLPVSFRTRIMPLFGLVCFILSVWSFVLTGLKMIPKIN